MTYFELPCRLRLSNRFISGTKSSVIFALPAGYSYISSSPNVSSPSHYTKGTPAELKKYHWFYGNITEEQTKAELSLGNGNHFLVRHTSDILILSLKIRGYVQHIIIHYSPEGYYLEGKDRYFQSVPEMTAYYQKYPIEEKRLQVLGKACDRGSSGIFISVGVE